MASGKFSKWAGLTRFDCALGSHALMRRAYSVALYHALQRQAFGKNLVDQPMMRQVLGQMALRLEGQTAFLFRGQGGTGATMCRKRYGQGCSRPPRNLLSANPGSRSSPRRWRCWAAQAIVKRVNYRACTVKCR